MSIADAVRTRALEARVAELERRLAALEQDRGQSEPSQAIRLMMGQINSLRARLDKADDAA